MSASVAKWGKKQDINRGKKEAQKTNVKFQWLFMRALSLFRAFSVR